MFKEFKDAVSKQFEKMREHQLYRTEVEKELMWITYIDSFLPGTNPKMRERTEHDCQACKSFIRAVGNMVAIHDGKLMSIWDGKVGAPYDVVASALSELVKNAPIKNVLLHDQQDVGVDKNFQYGVKDGPQVLTWEHFHLTLPQSCVSRERGTIYGDKETQKDVFQRALEEITVDSLETVLDLIAQNSLYRGEEHQHTVKKFLELKQEHSKLKGRKREFFVWRQDISPAITRIRNSAIGTLLDDLSKGTSLDDAVRMFESKVAPANYKRPKALVSKAMIDRARKDVEILGYTPALGRRFAKLEDITINNVLFADRDARRSMNADVFDDLIQETPTSPKSLEKVEEVPIETFIQDILPKATSVKLLLENKHSGNLVNLIAPVDPDAKWLFKWPNNFSWAYNGDVADSIRERVKRRGGSVTGVFRASLAWFNSDDLDLHLIEPNGAEICFMQKRVPSGGELDVDMNITDPVRNAVENITYANQGMMRTGMYRLFVHNFTHRESKDVGFEVELEFNGIATTFSCNREVRPREFVNVVIFSYSRQEGIKIIESLPKSTASKVMWGLPTQSFHQVQVIMLSPNHWDGYYGGNKHWFFMLKGCKREGSSRGFFNEQLSDDLRDHRKVFELLGGKMRTEEEGEQLSGLGFSSTQRNNVYAKVTGTFTRTINIMF